jgi:uroporphyrin-III C-methyltransferase/precorrin-2 dehydrogenase/sirohydrochlorin ferrochelatase
VDRERARARDVNAAFPVALKLAGRSVLVVGGGDEAALRADALLAAGARVTVVSETPSEKLVSMASDARLELVRRAPVATDLDGRWLLVLADRNPALADELAREAEQRALFYCAVDDARVGSFSHLAIARAGVVFAAVGSQGEAPALARRLRELMDGLFARAGLAAFAEKLAELRRVTPPERRHEVLNAAVRDVRLEGELVLPTAASNSPRA